MDGLRPHYNRFYLSKKREKGRNTKIFLQISGKNGIWQEEKGEKWAWSGGNGGYWANGQSCSILMIPQEKRKGCRTLTGEKIFFYHDEEDDVLFDD